MSRHSLPFWFGGFEGADHRNGRGVGLDMVRATGHLALLNGDYARLAAHGLGGVRESIGWRLSEPAPGGFDFSRAVDMAGAARRHGLQVMWTLMHYGTPDDVSMLDDRFIDRFARFAAAAARVLAPLHERPPVYNLINEIGFISWAVSETNLFHPYLGNPADRGDRTDASGYLVKRRLVRAVLAAVDAIRAVDPRARFVHIEPVVHVVASRDRPDLESLACEIAGYQWQAWDLIAGRLEPELGGSLDALDLVGVNHYHCGQWEVPGESRLGWHERDPRRRSLSDLLGDVWTRYAKPLLITETSHIGVGRAAWLHEIASEVRTARRRGVPVSGICLYPVIDRPDWSGDDHWHHSGLWDIDERSAASATQATETDADPVSFTRRLNPGYAAALKCWQRTLPEPLQPENQGSVMPTLIVFSHLRWNFVWQRPQQLMSRLARDHRVLFVEEPVHTDGPARLERISHGPSIDVLIPHTPIDAAGFHDLQLSMLRPLITDFLRHEGIDDYVAWFYTPMAMPLLASLTPRAVVYDCMDELSAFKGAPPQLHQRETALMKMAGLVLTGGPSLFEAKKDLHPNIHCLPSAVDAAHFALERPDDSSDDEQRAAALELQRDIGRPRLGFYGVIDERFDAPLLAGLAARRPDWQFVMVGPVVKIDPANLPGASNIHWLGMQPYARLPHLMADWDVCLMPFGQNDATRFISPTKTLEYMAAGKPVVSTAVRDVSAMYGDAVRIATGVDGFIAAIEDALGETGAPLARRQQSMQALVQRHSWDSAADTVRSLLAQERARPPTSLAAARALGGLEADPSHAGSQAALPLAATAAHRAHRPVRTLIIGAGPTGLSAAYHLRGNGHDTLLIEREDRVGGWCRSIQLDGFTWDYAGHIMFSNDRHVLALYDVLLGKNVHWQNREAWIYSKDVYTRYPFQGSLYGLPPKVLKECIVGAIEARFGALDAKPDGASTRDTAPPANFAEFIDRVWGRGIARHFATPYNEKLWALPLDQMETSWLGGRVPLPDLQQMIEGALEPTPAPMGPNARFGYPLEGGFQALMDGFLPHLDCELALKTSVLQISPATRTVRLDDGRAVRFESLISTMSLPRLIEACGDEAPADVQASAKALRHVSVCCVNLGVSLAPGTERLTDKHWIYYPEDSVFHRIFVQGNASPQCNAPGGFALTCEITYGPNKPLPCTGQALIDRVVADCHRVGIFGPESRVMSANVVDMPLAYVIYDHGRAQHVARIREWVSSFGIVLAGRYSEWEYYNSDHAFLAGRRAAEEVGGVLEQRLARAS